MKKGFGLVFGLLLAAGLAYPQKLRSPIKVATSPNHEARWSAMAFSADGVAHIVWEDNPPDDPNHTIQYVTYDGTKASSPINLKNQTGGNGHWPHITIGPSGLIAVVWGEESNVYLRVFDPAKKQWLNTESVKSGAGEDEPCVAIDPLDNIYVWWFDEAAIVYTRSKIDGQWQDTVNMGPGARAKAGYIAAGRDGRVWAIWHEKGDDGNYKGMYRKRTATTPWTEARHINDAGASWSHSSIAVGPDGIPWAAKGDVDESTGTNQEIWVLKMDEVSNPKTLAIPLFLQHFPRIAVDKNGVHVACAIGPGDTGWGVRYTNNIGGEFMPFQTFGAAWTKVPGIAVDGYGNVGVCWTSVQLNEGADIWLATKEKIVKRTAAAPKNPKGSIVSYDVADSETVYEFTWQANSANNPADLDAYRLYRQDAGSETDALLLTIPKTSLKARYTTTQYSADTIFKISALMKSGLESDKVLFGKIILPAVPAPGSIKQEVVFDGVNASKAVYNLTWQANPATKPSNLKEYRIYKRSNADAPWEFFVAASKTSLIVRTLVTEYSSETQFAVVAVLNAGFESARNPVTSKSSRTMAPPKNPGAEIVFDTTDATKLLYRFVWEADPANPPANLEGYQLYRKLPGSSWTAVGNVLTTLTTSVPITTYNDATTFGLTALHLGGVASARASVTLTRPALLAPTSAKAVYKLTGIKTNPMLTIDLAWAANAGSDDRFVTGYRIYQKEGSGSFQLIKTLAKSELAWSFTYAGIAPKLQFAVTTLSTLGIESPMAVIGETAAGTLD